jgi:menaquinone-dependent protoporphyrinogen oxidase
MKALIVYASRKGQTRKVAARIGNVLEVAGFAVQVHEILEVPARLEVEDFDLVVLGSGVRCGRHSGAVADFICAHREALAERPTAFFSVSGSAIPGTPDGEDRAREQVESFFEETEWLPDRTARFAGSVPYTRYGPLTRWIMKRVQQQAGRSTDTSRDHEYTDWVSVERFAAELVRLAERAGVPAGVR